MQSWLVGPTYKGSSNVIAAERCINLLPERVETLNPKSPLILRGSPGLRSFGTLPSQPGRATLFQDGRMFALVGEKFCEVFANGTTTTIGTVQGSGDPGSIVSNGDRGFQLLINSGTLAYTYNLSSGAFAQISDPQIPANILKVVFVDGYGVAITTDRFALSALFDFTTWNAEEGQRSGASDNLVGAHSDHEVLWLFGSLKTEVWYNSGAAAFPFQPIQGVFIEQGLAARNAVASFDNGVAWLGQGEGGGRVVWLAREYNPVRISTHGIEAMLAACTTVADAQMYTWQMEGHACLVLTIPSQDLTVVFDAATELWSEALYWNSTTGQYEAHRGITHVAGFGKNLVVDRETSAIHELTFQSYSDSGEYRRWMRQAPYIIDEHRTMVHKSLELGMRVGGGLTSGQGSQPVVGMQFSDDRAETWSTERYVSMGAQGKYKTRVKWSRLGAARERAYRVFGSEPVETVLTHGILNATVGAH